MKIEFNNSIWHDWAAVTTAHGFYDLSKAKSYVAKIVWFLLIAVSLSMMMFQLYRLISDFNHNLWASVIQEIPTDGILIPAVIFCNVNRIKKSKAKEFGLTEDMLQYIFMNMDVDYQILNDSFDAEEQFIEWRKANNFSYMDIFDKLTHSYEDMFISGSNKSDVKPIDNIEYGRCQCLDANKTSKVTGAKGGLKLLLDTQGWDYVPLYYNNHLYEGIAIQVAYNGRVQLGQWIMLQPGTRISVGIQVYENNLREDRRSHDDSFNPFAYLESQPPCERNPRLLFSEKAQYMYTVENCLKECEWLRAVRRCNCIPYIRNAHLRTCEVEELRTCQHSPTDSNDAADSISSDLKLEIEHCRATCKKPCYDKYVDVQQTSMTKAPSQAQFDNRIVDYLSAETKRFVRMEDMIMLRIYFNSLSIKSIQLYQVVTLENLVSSAGGLIGLWVGMSFLTVFQAIDYFIEFLKTRKQTNSKSKIDAIVSSLVPNEVKRQEK